MIKSFGLENFRIYKDRTDFDLKPITILTGRNNSGKSTLINAFRLLNNSMSSTGHVFSDLHFRNDQTNFGDFELVLNKNSKKDYFSIFLNSMNYKNLSFKLDYLCGITASDRVFEKEEDFIKDLNNRLYPNKAILYKVTLLLDDIEICLLTVSFNYDPYWDDDDNYQFKYSFNTKPGCVNDYKIDFNIKGIVETIKKGLLRKDQTKIPTDAEETSLLLKNKFHGFIKDTYKDIDSLVNDYLIIEGLDPIHYQRMSNDPDYANMIKEQAEGPYPIIWDDPIKEESKPNFLFTEIINIKKGNYIFFNKDRLKKSSKEWKKTFAQILLYLKDFQITMEDTFVNPNIVYLKPHRGIPQRMYSYGSGSLDLENVLYSFTEKSMPNMKFVRDWMGKFGVGGDIKITNNSGLSSIKIVKEGREQDLVDLGYGAVQLLPILLAIANYDSNTLFIEEPESHLHPRLQSLLADMFIEAKQKFKKQIIIETHSEYLIRKLQYNVAKGVVDKNDISIYYIDNEAEKINQKIEIRDDGILKQDFGSGFFDESTKLTIALLQHQNN